MQTVDQCLLIGMAVLFTAWVWHGGTVAKWAAFAAIMALAATAGR